MNVAIFAFWFKQMSFFNENFNLKFLVLPNFTILINSGLSTFWFKHSLNNGSKSH